VKTWPVKLNTGAQKRGQMIQVEFDVPLCAECSAKENKIGNVTWISFFIVGAIVFVLVFIPVWLLSPEGTTAQTIYMPEILGASAGLIAGMIAGTLVEFLLKISFASSYGKLLLKRPLTMISIFSDSVDLIGFSSRFVENRTQLKLSFENDTIGREFTALNSQEIG
jgi:thiamine transporter ThiT